MTSPERALRVVVRGLVQGVSFRYFTCQEARGRDVRGWVRNLPDGRVEAHVQGYAADVDALVAWMRRGPPAARVEGLDLEEIPADEALRNFETRR